MTGPGLGSFAGMSGLQIRLVLRNADRLAKRKRDPAWAFAIDVFGVGSTVAFNLCRHAGIDPTLPISKQPS